MAKRSKGPAERPLARLERKLLEFRTETSGEFGAVRQEMAAGLGAVRQEMTNGFTELRHEVREGDAETRRQVLVVIESLRDDIRMIAEGHVELDRRVRRLEGRG